MPSRNALRRWWWGGVGLYAGVLLIVSIIPLPSGPDIPALDKFFHALEYAVLGWLLVQAQRRAGPAAVHVVGVAVLAAVGYGTICEAIQGWLPYRDAEGWDVIANAVGSVLGAQLVRAPRHG